MCDVRRAGEISSVLLNQRKESTKTASHLILDVDERAHVQLLGEGHAVIEFNAVHSGVIKVKAFQLQSQQVWEMEESQALERKKKRCIRTVED